MDCWSLWGKNSESIHLFHGHLSPLGQYLSTDIQRVTGWPRGLHRSLLCALSTISTLQPAVGAAHPVPMYGPL